MPLAEILTTDPMFLDCVEFAAWFHCCHGRVDASGQQQIATVMPVVIID